MSASQDQVVTNSVPNGVSGTSSPPAKRLKEDEELMDESLVPTMVAPVPLWTVPESDESRHCINDVRGYKENYYKDALELAKTNSYKLIDLSIGNPAVYGNLPPDPSMVSAVVKATTCGDFHGYGHSSGLEVARRAVAELYSSADPETPLTHNDVVMTCSISGAIEMSFTALANPGQNVLCPTPGFGLFKCHLAARGVEPRFYKLLPERSWEANLEDMERQIDTKTAAILVCNPSNPCGSVFSQQHLRDIVAVAERHCKPIIADETYAWMVFQGQEFHSVASVSRTVPVLSCGGLSKRFMVPGWRLGWILIHDRNGAFQKEVIPGLTERLPMKLLGPCTLIQGALPDIFKTVPESFHKCNMDIFEENAKGCMEELRGVPGLRPVMPAGAMYMMVVIELEHFPEFKDDISFARQLLAKKSVFCLPGKAFCATSCFRIVLMMTKDKIKEAGKRIREFCQDHYQP